MDVYRNHLERIIEAFGFAGDFGGKVKEEVYLFLEEIVSIDVKEIGCEKAIREVIKLNTILEEFAFRVGECFQNQSQGPFYVIRIRQVAIIRIREGIRDLFSQIEHLGVSKSEIKEIFKKMAKEKGGRNELIKLTDLYCNWPTDMIAFKYFEKPLLEALVELSEENRGCFL